MTNLVVLKSFSNIVFVTIGIRESGIIDVNCLFSMARFIWKVCHSRMCGSERHHICISVYFTGGLLSLCFK